ncbi:hypothetical protein [Tepidibacter aestuarii]|uniref:hypothetical protein n=1 Tax=Tepidibacter aestuarii TaxID=2925782 RepID=UPI0020BFAD58|nr:hypothetical protein [Tepidibacter aestuarii]CAH2213646.1 conserved protein of unknown function [Tepidibacter aestuarii]CAH2215652.1 conserved protein of unknown function [Tepidibacter aestuarii]
MENKLDYIKYHLDNGYKIEKLKRKNRHIGKIILSSEGRQKKIIALFGEELNKTAQFYFELLDKGYYLL